MVLTSVLQYQPLVAIGQQSENGSGFPFTPPKDWRELPASALVETTSGPFELQLARSEAPLAVANFWYLGKEGFFRGVELKKSEAIAGALVAEARVDKQVWPQNWVLPPEHSVKLKHTRGALGWALVVNGEQYQRQASGRTIYLCLEPQPQLDGFSTLFAHIVRGMRNVENLKAGDKIIEVRFPRNVEQLKE